MSQDSYGCFWYNSRKSVGDCHILLLYLFAKQLPILFKQNILRLLSDVQFVDKAILRDINPPSCIILLSILLYLLLLLRILDLLIVLEIQIG